MRKKRGKKVSLAVRVKRLEKRVDRLAKSSGLPAMPAQFLTGTPTARYSSRPTRVRPMGEH